MLKGKHTCSNNKKTPKIVLQFMFINQHDHACNRELIEAANMLKLEAWIKQKKKKGILLKLCLVLYSEIGLKKLFSLIKRKITTFFFFLSNWKKKKKKEQNKTYHIHSFHFENQMLKDISFSKMGHWKENHLELKI